MYIRDHEPLKYFNSKRDLNKRQSRWIEKLVDVNPVIQWIPEKDQFIPDALSRRPDYSKCSSLVVEPSILRNISKCTLDSNEVEITTLVASVQQANSNLRIIKQQGIDLLLRITTIDE